MPTKSQKLNLFSSLFYYILEISGLFFLLTKPLNFFLFFLFIIVFPIAFTEFVSIFSKNDYHFIEEKLSDILLDNSPVAVTQEKPLSAEEVRELLKDYPSWGEAVLQERAEAN